MKKERRYYRLGIALFSISYLACYQEIVHADQTMVAVTSSEVSSSQATVVVDIAETEVAMPKEELRVESDASVSVKDVQIVGEVNPGKEGLAYYDDLTIDVVASNLTDDHLLTSEGLHWSEESQVELISGQEEGRLTKPVDFGLKENANVTVYSLEEGTKGRITHIGRTRSGIDLDLLWTIKDSDTEKWRKESGDDQDGTVRGLAFAGEQHVTESKGNSIVVLYNRANRLDMLYQIVKHGTLDEVPVLVSFITTDIDVSQGVKTNLANLVQLVPEASGLAVKDGIIYDTTPIKEENFGSYLNGSKDLPKGGYLGAGFLSRFDYTFYAPVPESIKQSYEYAGTVRYDIFGSSLQAKMTTKILPHIQVNFQDANGVSIKPSQFYKGLTAGRHQISIPTIDGYVFNNHSQEQRGKATILNFIYDRENQITFRYLDENGKPLLSAKTFTVKSGTLVDQSAPVVGGYEQPSVFKSIVTENKIYDFIYKKKPIPKEMVFHYLDEQGKQLSPSETVIGYIGKKLIKKPLSKENYITPGTFEETITQSGEHRFVYHKIRYPRQLRFLFVDESGRELRPAHVITRKDGDFVSYRPLDINGYRLPSTVSFVVTDDAHHRFIYQYVGNVAVGSSWGRPSIGRIASNTASPTSNYRFTTPGLANSNNNYRYETPAPIRQSYPSVKTSPVSSTPTLTQY